MPRMVIHLGPPKCASSSIQMLFQSFDQRGVRYLGRTHPEPTPKNEFAKILLSMATCKASSYQREIFANQIENMKMMEEIFIVSEEMILVDRPKTSYQDTLQRIFKLLKDFDLEILLCLRDPVSALQSLYLELIRGLPLAQVRSFDRFLASNQARVFDYTLLVDDLHCAGFDKVRAVAFEDVTVNGFPTAAILGKGEIRQSLPRANDKGLASASAADRIGSITVGDIGKVWIRRHPQIGYALRLPLVRALWTNLQTAEITDLAKRTFDVPIGEVDRLRTSHQRVLARYQIR